MSADRTKESEPDSLARARLVNAACDRHEAAWRAGMQPRIEEERAGCPEPAWPEMFAELLALEIELRQGRGDHPTASEYLDRFPDQAIAIHAAINAPTSGGGGRADCPETRLVAPGSSRMRCPELTRTDPDGIAMASPIWDGVGGDLGDFELLEEIARGGMGIVYKARKRSLNCLVALKIMQAGPLASEAEKKRFLLEAEAAANLNHPNIVPVYEIDRVRGLYFTMKWVEGSSLDRQIAALVGDSHMVARILATVARAVHDAHRHGFLHRDLKPANILLDEQGKPYVTDFGLARRVGGDSGLTQSGTILGTPSYMAPEQAGGLIRQVGPTADVYSLGAILYELITGRPPFRAGTVMETLVLVLERDPTPPAQLRPDVPPELEAICLKCLEKNPADRYPSAESLAEDLEGFLRGEDVQAMRAGPWLGIRRWTRREPQLVARLIGLGTVEALTQLNYALIRHRDIGLHVGVSAALAAWAVASVALQALARRERWRNTIRPAWAAADVAFLTIILWQLDAVGSSMIVGYPLVVAVSGLWFRVGLVWLATALAEAGFGILVLDGWLRGTLWKGDHHPNIVMAVIAITGFVVARQVKRLLVLSSYYEHRLPS